MASVKSDAESRHAQLTQDVTRLAGTYRAVWRPQGRRGIIAYVRWWLTAPSFSIRVDDDGSLIFGSGRFVQIEPLLFRRQNGRDYIAFCAGPDGTITAMFNESFTLFERIK
jgi:hypothetical protein